MSISTVLKKPVLVDNEMENHEFLSVSVLFDHDIVDGVSATRFISRLSSIVEKGNILRIMKNKTK